MHYRTVSRDQHESPKGIQKNTRPNYTDLYISNENINAPLNKSPGHNNLDISAIQKTHDDSFDNILHDFTNNKPQHNQEPVQKSPAILTNHAPYQSQNSHTNQYEAPKVVYGSYNNSNGSNPQPVSSHLSNNHKPYESSKVTYNTSQPIKANSSKGPVVKRRVIRNGVVTEETVNPTSTSVSHHRPTSSQHINSSIEPSRRLTSATHLPQSRISPINVQREAPVHKPAQNHRTSQTNQNSNVEHKPFFESYNPEQHIPIDNQEKPQLRHVQSQIVDVNQARKNPLITAPHVIVPKPPINKVKEPEFPPTLKNIKTNPIHPNNHEKNQRKGSLERPVNQEKQMNKNTNRPQRTSYPDNRNMHSNHPQEQSNQNDYGYPDYHNNPHNFGNQLPSKNDLEYSKAPTGSHNNKNATNKFDSAFNEGRDYFHNFVLKARNQQVDPHQFNENSINDVQKNFKTKKEKKSFELGMQFEKNMMEEEEISRMSHRNTHDPMHNPNMMGNTHDPMHNQNMMEQQMSKPHQNPLPNNLNNERFHDDANRMGTSLTNPNHHPNNYDLHNNFNNNNFHNAHEPHLPNHYSPTKGNMMNSLRNSTYLDSPQKQYDPYTQDHQQQIKNKQPIALLEDIHLYINHTFFNEDVMKRGTLAIEKFERMVKDIYTLLNMPLPIEAEVFDLRRQVKIEPFDKVFNVNQILNAGTIIFEFKKKYHGKKDHDRLREDITKLKHNQSIDNCDRPNIFDNSNMQKHNSSMMNHNKNPQNNHNESMQHNPYNNLHDNLHTSMQQSMHENLHNNPHNQLHDMNHPQQLQNFGHNNNNQIGNYKMYVDQLTKNYDANYGCQIPKSKFAEVLAHFQDYFKAPPIQDPEQLAYIVKKAQVNLQIPILDHSEIRRVADVVEAMSELGLLDGKTGCNKNELDLYKSNNFNNNAMHDPNHGMNQNHGIMNNNHNNHNSSMMHNNQNQSMMHNNQSMMQSNHFDQNNMNNHNLSPGMHKMMMNDRIKNQHSNINDLNRKADSNNNRFVTGAFEQLRTQTMGDLETMYEHSGLNLRIIHEVVEGIFRKLDQDFSGRVQVSEYNDAARQLCTVWGMQPLSMSELDIIRYKLDMNSSRIMFFTPKDLDNTAKMAAFLMPEDKFNYLFNDANAYYKLHSKQNQGGNSHYDGAWGSSGMNPMRNSHGAGINLIGPDGKKSRLVGDDCNNHGTGNNNHAMGNNNHAMGNNNHAMGNNNLGMGSTLWPGNNHAMGNNHGMDNHGFDNHGMNNTNNHGMDNNHRMGNTLWPSNNDGMKNSTHAMGNNHGMDNHAMGNNHGMDNNVMGNSHGMNNSNHGIGNNHGMDNHVMGNSHGMNNNHGKRESLIEGLHDPHFTNFNSHATENYNDHANNRAAGGIHTVSNQNSGNKIFDSMAPTHNNPMLNQTPPNLHDQPRFDPANPYADHTNRNAFGDKVNDPYKNVNSLGVGFTNQREMSSRNQNKNQVEKMWDNVVNFFK